MPSSLLRVSGVVKSFGAAAVLRGADLTASQGQIVALLGPSGCGKTTLLRVIAGLERADAGEVRLGDELLEGRGTFVPPERRRVGMVFQDWALFPHLSVRRNVAFGLDRATRRDGRVDETLALVELADLADRMPATLSGGQQQRVALARALAPRPALLLLDEPFSNLDASLRGSIREEVVRLLRELSLPAVIVTHDQEEAFLLGDEVAVMLGGRVVQQAPPAQLYARPADAAVAAFVGDANFLPGRSAGATAQTPIGTLPLQQQGAGEVQVVVRPEHLVLEPGSTGAVRRVDYYGHDAVSLVELPGGHLLRVRVLSAPGHEVGDRVDVRYTGGPAVAFPAR